MFLFGSQRNRNKRLFDSVYLRFAKGTSQVALEAWQKDTLMSVYAGGSAAANRAVDGCEALRKAWGKGDERRALILTTVFAMPIVVRLYRWSPGATKLGLATRLEQIEGALWAILHAPGDLPFSPDETRQEYMGMARQFEFEEEARENQREGQRKSMYHWIEMDYLLSKALRALGQRSAYRLGGVELPVPGVAEFVEQGGIPGLDFNDLTSYAALFDAVTAGAAVAGRVMRELSNLQAGD